jgi:hypothetical protein
MLRLMGEDGLTRPDGALAQESTISEAQARELPPELYVAHSGRAMIRQLSVPDGASPIRGVRTSEALGQ